MHRADERDGALHAGKLRSWVRHRIAKRRSPRSYHSGLPSEKCEVYKINLGRGFGRPGAYQAYVTQAVNIAKRLPARR